MKKTPYVVLCLLAGCATRPAELFREAARDSGVEFHHFNGARGDYYMPEIVGPGVALLDYDGDGDLDLFLVQGGFIEPGAPYTEAAFPPAAGFQPGCRLYRNELIPGGTLRFTDVTAQAGVGIEFQAMGAAVGDYDNDGRPDLLVTGYRRAVLFHNDGAGRFTDVTRQAGLDEKAWATSATFFDYDRDGLLDLFIAHYVNFNPGRKRQCQSRTGEPDYCGPQVYLPSVSRLMHNEGRGRFRDVTSASGMGAAAGPGLGVVAADFNGDGWPDLYVANDKAASYLWINQGNGTFREKGVESGVAYNSDGRAQAGMGIGAGDFDNDGDEDIFKTNLREEGGNLYRNDGHGFFTDAIAETGLYTGTFRYTGFGAAWFDYDNDGWLDLVVINGAVFMEESQRGTRFPYLQPRQLFHNEAGRRFIEVSSLAGRAFQTPEVGRGVALGDIDNDGRVDFVVSNNNGPTRIFLNQSGAGNHWLSIRLKGVKLNRMGIGARVAVMRAGERPLWRRAHTDGSYLSASDARVHFGLGAKGRVDGIVVEWPDGSKEQWGATPADREITIEQGRGRPQ